MCATEQSHSAEYEREPTGYCACGGQRWTEAGTGRYRGIASYRCDGCGVLFAGCGYQTPTEAIAAKRRIDGSVSD